MLRSLITLSLTTILIENFVLVKFLGICPFLGVSKKVETAIGMGMAVTFVMTVSSIATYGAQKYLLVFYHLEYLQTIVFILIIATLVQFVEMVLQKTSPILHQTLGIYLPLITTNCAVLGVAILNTTKQYNFISAVTNGASGGIGFTLAIILLAGVRERLDISDIPESMKGFPIVLISAALISLAFFGFQGLRL